MFKLVVLTGLVMGILICMTSAQRGPRPFGGPNGRPFGRPHGNGSHSGGNGTRPHWPFGGHFGRNHSAKNGTFGPPRPFKPLNATQVAAIMEIAQISGNGTDYIDEYYNKNGSFASTFHAAGRRSGGGSGNQQQSNTNWMLPMMMAQQQQSSNAARQDAGAPANGGSANGGSYAAMMAMMMQQQQNQGGRRGSG